MDEKHVSNATPKDKEQPENGLPLRPVAPKNMWKDKRLWVVIGLFAFTGIVGGFVPASKIPLFSTLVEAMGFSSDEAGEMSLLKALLKWHQKYQAGKADAAEKLSAEEIAANARASAERNLALSEYEMTQNKKNLDSLLISMRKVNSQQRRDGRDVDVVRGAAVRERGSETEDKAVAVKNIDAPVQTEANTSAQGEVLFGQEAGVVQRDEHHGFNSTKMLSKIENPHIAGSTSSTWMMQTMDRAVRADSNLGQIAKELDTRGHAVNFDNIKNIGKDRPHRDLSYAWLTGKAAYRTPNRMLKKTLAAAGFQGEDMPRKVFDSSLIGVGVGIDPNDVSMDAKSVRTRYDKEEKCKNKLLFGSSSKKDTYAKIKTDVKSLRGQFPSTCKEAAQDNALAGLQSTLGNISQECRKINATYAELREECSVSYLSGECANLAHSYDSRLTSFQTECDNLYKKCLNETDADGNPVNTPEICAARRDETRGGDLDGQCQGGQCDGDQVYYDARHAITGYGADEDDDFNNNDNMKIKDNGDNESSYLASQNVQDIIDTLRGLNKKNNKNTP